MKRIPIRVAILDDLPSASQRRKNVIEDRFRTLPTEIEVKTFEFVEDFIAEVDKGRLYDVIISDLFMKSKGPPKGDHARPEDGGLKVFDWLRRKRTKDTDFVRVQLLWVSTRAAVNQTAARVSGDVRSWFNWIEESGTPEYFAAQVERMIETATSRFVDLYFPEAFTPESPAMAVVMDRAFRIAHGKHISILLTGESGVGKEYLARRIAHESGLMPFVACNCASITDSIFESDLFGYTKGAFTGANADRPGLFEMANGGTLFLDEIGDMPLNQQAKILQALENRAVRRVGGVTTHPADFRLISATHRNLEERIKSKDFREDLLFRIRTTELHIPPLRERREELRTITAQFLRAYGGASPPGLSAQVEEVFSEYPWPGNVRELQSQIQMATILARGRESILVEHLDGKVKLFAEGKLPEFMPSVEEERIGAMLRSFDGNRQKCAVALGIPPRTLYDKISKSEFLKRLDKRLKAAYQLPAAGR